MQEEVNDLEELRCPTCKSPIVLVPVAGNSDQWELECKCRPEKFMLPQSCIAGGNPAAGFLFIYTKKKS